MNRIDKDDERDPALLDQAGQELVITAKMLHSLGLAAGTGGNLSMRLGETILATPSGSHKGFLKAGDLVQCDLSGRPLGPGRPTSEMGMHLAAYQARPEVGAVIHAHPPLITALTVAGIRPEAAVLPEAVAGLGEIPVAPYARPGSMEGVKSIQPLVADHQVIVLDRHGCLTMGRNPVEALARVEELEHLARVMIAAHGLGRMKKLNPDQEQELLDLGRSLGLIK